ncbi:hypothetical protein TBLA_0A09650 [Henningerozyma blattae CBS 6284]|uniref:Uncharacterized protein n=1 Tax=Henningerozyma blattae (strain ATCC 34711 / CBS 6284 / DSM 70876 / NBRC 10599 / NRRL Y-10934 / UCD 77-7) TaxID=1071380 RepID=I2GX97_HENB6|nr:hypothetical protein TBLA_0A09650 [Tetrapisispora blattae CBS 6284]CCH58749.1 hypothetical protein TBLA_0A09650 [Tetrapisispora blattae CBS 6284]
MGISGLLPQLKTIQNPVSLRRYEGQTLAIDGYAWLHRAAFSCAYELAMDIPTDRYLQFFIKKFSMLRTFNIEPYLVFDGDSLPVKKNTEKKRRTKRDDSKEIAIRLWNAGEKRNAMDYFQKSVSITPEMAKCIIDYCKNNHIRYIVAPFEADSQMVYLEKKGIVQGIISEDSDLLIFGCQRLITKLNDYAECIEICSLDFGKLTVKFPLGKLTPLEMIAMVCLSGCDYTDGIPKIGLVNAMKLIQQHHSMDRILLNLRRAGKHNIPENFEQEYKNATFAFQFQRVFCPIGQKLVHLNDISPKYAKLQGDMITILYSCIGPVIHKDKATKEIIIDDSDIDHETHSRLALGELHPRDYSKPLINREIKLQLSSKSIQLPDGSGNQFRTSMDTQKQIDGFFHKTQTKSKISTSDKIKKQMLANKTNSINITDKLNFLVQKRKLSNKNYYEVSANENSSEFPKKKSKYFKQITKSGSDSLVNVEISTTQLIKPTDNNLMDSDAPISTTDDYIETEVPESELPTEIPSSINLNSHNLDSDPDFFNLVESHLKQPTTKISNINTFKLKASTKLEEKLGDDDDEEEDNIPEPEEYFEKIKAKTKYNDKKDPSIKKNNSKKDTNIPNNGVIVSSSSNRTLCGSTNLLSHYRYAIDDTSNCNDKPSTSLKVSSSRKPLTESNVNIHRSHSSKNSISTENSKFTSTKHTLLGNKTQHIIIKAKATQRSATMKECVKIEKQPHERSAKRSVSLLSQYIYRDK